MYKPINARAYRAAVGGEREYCSIGIGQPEGVPHEHMFARARKSLHSVALVDLLANRLILLGQRESSCGMHLDLASLLLYLLPDLGHVATASNDMGSVMQGSQLDRVNQYWCSQK